ncbi:MAG TPA: hypothetical protein VE987_19400, partial [Polyangiaceae bacterium]|nr:hypothetical protein [Polyangiaceae bacterium]
MKKRVLLASIELGVTVTAVALSLPARADSPRSTSPAAVQLATGQFVAPTAVRGAVQQPLNPGLPGYPDFVAGEAVRSALSPDGATLAVLCAGQNSLYKPDGTIDVADSTQYIFLYDVSGARKQAPALVQVIQQTNAHVGLAFSPDGSTLYAAGGRDDVVYASSDRDREVVVIDVSSATGGRLVKRIKLDGNGLGMTLDASGTRLFVAEDNADQVAVIDTVANAVVRKIDARAPRGLLSGSDDDALDPSHPRAARYTGAATFAVTLSRDGKTLYAVNAGANSVAVIPLYGERAYQVSGLIPTAYEPHDVTFSADGTWMYIVNGKSVTGPNPGHLAGSTAEITSITYPGGNAAAAAAARAANQYQFQLERASLVSAPVPGAEELDRLTRIVAANNFYGASVRADDERVMSFLRQHIKHVIYVVKENRTYDQILGDLGNGANGDASLTQFGAAITPNLHQLARGFVTLDNFMDPGDGSMDGWSWSLQGRVTNTETITQQINYAFVNRGLSYESEGANRNVPVNWATAAQRDAAAGPAGTTNYSIATASLLGGTANLLAGTGNHASADAPFGEQDGYIFSAVLQAGGTVRNYGFHVNNIGSIGTTSAPITDPFAAGEIQVAPLAPSLAALTDVYFRGFDQNYPDLWRYDEWK